MVLKHFFFSLRNKMKKWAKSSLQRREERDPKKWGKNLGHVNKYVHRTEAGSMVERVKFWLILSGYPRLLAIQAQCTVIGWEWIICFIGLMFDQPIVECRTGPGRPLTGL